MEFSTIDENASLVCHRSSSSELIPSLQNMNHGLSDEARFVLSPGFDITKIGINDNGKIKSSGKIPGSDTAVSKEIFAQQVDAVYNLTSRDSLHSNMLPNLLSPVKHSGTSSSSKHNSTMPSTTVLSSLI